MKWWQLGITSDNCLICNEKHKKEFKIPRPCNKCSQGNEKFIRYCQMRPDAIIPFKLFIELKSRDCEICQWEYRKDIHHVDENYKNNDEVNLMALCRNHHEYVHLLNKKVEQFAKVVAQLKGVLA